MATGAQPGGKALGFTNSRRIGLAKAREIQTIEDFIEGYRNREDTSLLKPQTLVAGSHDVLINRSGTVQSRQGYIMDGAQSAVVSPIRAPFDWRTGTGYLHHLRGGFLTSAGNDGKLQIRFVDTFGALGPVNAVNWLDLLTTQTSVYFQYAPYWDTAALQSKLLMVNRTNSITEWNGAITTVNANTSTTLTTDGTLTFAQLGFSFKNSNLGDATTAYTVTNPSGNTFTFTFSSGTNPNITSSTMPVGTLVTLGIGGAQLGIAAGQYAITAIGSNFFSVTTPGASTGTYTGLITYDGGYSFQIHVNGVDYTYTAGAQSTTLLGLTSLPAFTQHIPAWQTPLTFTFAGVNSAMTFGSITPTPSSFFTCDLIGVIRATNQVVVASILRNQVYLSKAGTYKDYSQSTARVQYEGDMFTTVGPVTSLQPQENAMYVSAGNDEWYTTNFATTTTTNSTTGTTTIFENAQLQQLKTAALQAAQSQYASTKIANDVVFLSNEPIVRSLGRVAGVLTTPQLSDLSFPIQNDIDAYNATDAWCAYNKQLLYVGFPKMGLFRIYNMTNPKASFWEAPQNIALSGVSFIGTTVLGHSYLLSESYVMNTGYSDRAASANQTGLPISWSMVFAFQTSGMRGKRKSFNKFFVEGYIGSATTVSVGFVYRSPDPGILPVQTLTLSGAAKYVLSAQSLVSLGKSSLGKNPLGGDIQYPAQITLPPYFAVIKTVTRKPHLSYQPWFTGYGVNQVFQLLAYGNNGGPTSENETDITI